MLFIKNLISKIGLFIFFLVLEALSVFLIFSNNGYHKSVIGKGIMSFNGYASGKVNYITHFFTLPEENERLINENAELKQILSNIAPKDSLNKNTYLQTDSTNYTKYIYKTGQIIDYSLRKKDNYFLINKGEADGVKENMAVLSPKGIVGAVLSTSKHYASIISILHSKTNIKAKIKNLNYFGIIQWPGEDHRKLALKEIPKYLSVKLGDTVVTAGASSIYPENLLIGRVSHLTPNEKTGDLEIEVTTFEDLANVRNVYIVENLDTPDINQAKKKEKELTDDK